MVTLQIVWPEALTEREVEGYEKATAGGRGSFRQRAELLLPRQVAVNGILLHRPRTGTLDLRPLASNAALK